MTHRRIWLLLLFIALAVPAGASAKTTSIESEVDDPAWLQANGLTPVATLEVSDDAAKLPERCWHARVFAGLRAYNQGEHKFAAWAWNQGVVCSLDGRIAEFHQRHGKGSNDPWHDGPYPSIAEHRRLPRTCCHVFSSYQTDWKMGSSWESPNWGVTLNLHQYWSKHVDRKVAWHHYASS